MGISGRLAGVLGRLAEDYPRLRFARSSRWSAKIAMVEARFSDSGLGESTDMQLVTRFASQSPICQSFRNVAVRSASLDDVADAQNSWICGDETG